MVEEDALKMDILHIEGEDSDWWFHCIITLGHDHILCYEGFSSALMERFKREDLELPFKELVQLKQVGTPKAYMLEFENISVIVSDVYMYRLVLLFTEGLKEPLIGLVKSHKPDTLKDGMCLIRDLENVFLGTKYPPKLNFHSKFKEGKKPWKRDSSTKENKGVPSKEDLRRNNLNFLLKN